MKFLDINSEQEIPEPKEGTSADATMLPAERGVVFCNCLFFLECLYNDLPAEEWKQKRQKKEPAIWDEFWFWLDMLNPAEGGKLEKAVDLCSESQGNSCELSFGWKM